MATEKHKENIVQIFQIKYITELLIQFFLPEVIMTKLLIVILSLNCSYGLLANDEEKELEELLMLTQNDSDLEEALFKTLEKELKKLGRTVSYENINNGCHRSWEDIKKDLNIYLNNMPFSFKRLNYSTSDAPDKEIKKVVRFNKCQQ